MSLKEFTLLYVEDDLETQESIQLLLEDEVKEFYQAFDGREGLEMYINNKPDIIVTDINMPVLDGLSMAKEIRKINKTQAILVTSAYGDRENLREFINIGLDKFIDKPINMEIMFELLDASSKRLKVKKLQDTSKPLEKTIIINDTLYYDIKQKSLYYREKELYLTVKERDFLFLLFSNLNQTQSLSTISLSLWGCTDYDYGNNIRTLVKKIRKILPENIVKNVFGYGYKIEKQSLKK